MKFFVIEEFGIKTGDEFLQGFRVQKVEVPDKLLEEFKVAFEEWLKKQGEVKK